ncbi:hypothetical protein ACFQ60_39960 [Streptomyces zhihengii]
MRRHGPGRRPDPLGAPGRPAARVPGGRRGRGPDPGGRPPGPPGLPHGRALRRGPGPARTGRHGARRGRALPPEDPDDDPAFWDYGCGFVDADTVIASTTDSDEDLAGRHWLLDARTLRVRGTVAYPPGRGGGHVRPLGDGTWLTFDPARETLDRWAPEAG